MSKRLFIIIGPLLLLILAGVAGGRWWMGRSFPQTSGDLRLNGLEAPVEIERDEWGIPHLYADSLHDLYFAQGVVHAQDRLWQMDLQRRVGLGRLSELLGEPSVESDRLARTLGLGAAARQDLEALSEEGQSALRAYADGVNSYVAATETLPVEYQLLSVGWEPWAPAHSLALLKVFQWEHAGSWQEELLRAELLQQVGTDEASLLLGDDLASLSPALPIGSPDFDGFTEGLARSNFALSAGRADQGANGWVVGGERTATGQPILVSTAQAEPAMPGPWYMIALHAGEMNVAGASLPGLPAILLGHNNSIAWGMSTAESDSQDLYIERLNEAEATYEWRGQQEPLGVRAETIQVRGSEPITVEVQESRHGPLIDSLIDGLSEPVALQWSATAAPSRLFDAILALNHAATREAFLDALAMWDEPAQTFLYADTDGTIGQVVAGAQPLRPDGGGLVPRPGWTGEWEWQGMRATDPLPEQWNPAQGFVIATGEKNPSEMAGRSCASLRATRLQSLIEEQRTLTPEGMEAMLGDVTSLVAPEIAPYLLAVQSDDIIVQRAQEQLGKWNHQMAGDLPGAAIYSVSTGFVLQHLLADDLGGAGEGEQLLLRTLDRGCAPLMLLLQLLDEPEHPLWDDSRTAEREERDEILLRALTDMTDWLGRRYGDVPHEWFWERPHNAALTHSLDGISPLGSLFSREAEGTGGAWTTLNTNGFSYRDDYRVTYLPGYRQIIDVGEWDNSRALLSTGQSGQPLHPHYGDMLEPWRRVALLPLFWSDSRTDEAREGRVLRLVP